VSACGFPARELIRVMDWAVDNGGEQQHRTLLDAAFATAQAHEASTRCGCFEAALNTFIRVQLPPAIARKPGNVLAMTTAPGNHSTRNGRHQDAPRKRIKCRS
jgi:hypothetical protein